MSENYKNFDSTPIGQAGDVDVTGWRILGNHVRLAVCGPVDFGFDLTTTQARALAAQLIAAADYAEGRDA